MEDNMKNAEVAINPKKFFGGKRRGTNAGVVSEREERETAGRGREGRRRAKELVIHSHNCYNQCLGMPFFIYTNPIHGPILTQTFGKFLYYFLVNYLFSKVKDP